MTKMTVILDQNDHYEAKWALFEIHTQKTVIQRVEKLSVILAEYDTKMTDIWRTHQTPLTVVNQINIIGYFGLKWFQNDRSSC